MPRTPLACLPAGLLVLSAALGTGACIVPEGSRPTAQLGLDVATAYVHRGMIQNENGVLQPELVVTLPAEQDGTLIFRGWGNVDLTNDTGDAWLPDGHAGRFSQLDWNFLYAQAIDSFLLTFGLVSYNLPNGLEFRFGERGATTELLVEATTVVGPELRPTLAVHYDFDEVDGAYVEAALAREFPLDERMGIDAELSLAFMSSGQAFWNFAMVPAVSGLGDLVATGEYHYDLDAHTRLVGLLGLSTVVDGDYRDWFESDIDVDPDQVWFSVGVEWTY